MKKRKLAIIATGGGMRCVFTAGFFYELQKEFPSLTPDILISVSGSSGTFAYYVSEQAKEIKKIWEELMTARKFIHDSKINVDYLIDIVFKKRFPLDVKKIKNSKIKWFIGATDAKTGRQKFFLAKGKENVFEELRASKAIPVYYGKKIKIKNREYIDGAVSITPRNIVKKAKELGATDIILINNEEKNVTTEEKIKFAFFYLFSSNGIKKDLIKILKDSPIKKQKNKSLIKVGPSKLKMELLDNNKKLMKKGFKMGRNEIKQNKLLRKILRKFN